MDNVSTPTSPPLLVDARTAARFYLSISPRTLFSLTKSGQIPAVRIGRSVRYSTDTLRAWIVQREARP